MKTLKEIAYEIVPVLVCGTGCELSEHQMVEFSRLLIRAAFAEIKPKTKMGNTDFDNGFNACKLVFYENSSKFLGELDENGEEFLK